MDLKHFLEVEKKYRLYTDSIAGVNYWVYSRFLLWNEIILRQKINFAKAHNLPKQNLFTKGISCCRLLKNAFCRKKLPAASVSICFMNHSRRVKNGSFYECVYTDELAALYSDSVVLEHPYQLTHLTPVPTKHLIYTDSIAIKGNLHYLLYKRFHTKKYENLLKEIENRIRQPLNELEEAYCLTFDRMQVCCLIAKQILIYKGKYPCFQKLISKINPKLLVEVVHYDMDCMIANEICRQRNITTVELQHGMMSGHIAYQYDSDSELCQLPQKIFLFSDYWRSCIHLPIADAGILAVGYPYYEKKRNETQKNNIYSDSKINLLFISQGTIGKQLSELAAELAKKLDTEKYRIVYKLHPGELAIWEDKYPGLRNEAIEVIYKNDFSLYDYFKISSMQIGVYSTALYEGIGFGLPTCIYHIEAADCMENLCSAGFASYVNNADELYQYIQQRTDAPQVLNTLWKSDALKNMQRELQKCFSEKEYKND